MEHRTEYQKTWEILKPHRQMVFISGPRQAGKTTFARMLASEAPNSLYFNWDLPDDKKRLIENPLFYEDVNRRDPSKPIVILDEIHKYHDWKNFLKGAYDRDGAGYKFLVTGSGRLDLYRKGGDSLAGRYFLFHLWPFTLGELHGGTRSLDDFLRAPLECVGGSTRSIRNAWESLAELSGFPDPFLSGKKQTYNIWSRAYHRQLVREDVRDLTGIKNIETLEAMFSVLPARIGSPLSMNNLAGDLKVSFDSVKSWLRTFDDFYVTFRIAPWSEKITRAITKEKKLYLFDYALVGEEGARFENMVALELHRAVTGWTEQGNGDYALHYVRTKDGDEVDFLLTRNGLPFLLVECKLSDNRPTPALLKIQSRLNIPAVQLVNQSGVYKLISNDNLKVAVISADRWITSLP